MSTETDLIRQACKVSIDMENIFHKNTISDRYRLVYEDIVNLRHNAEAYLEGLPNSETITDKLKKTGFREAGEDMYSDDEGILKGLDINSAAYEAFKALKMFGEEISKPVEAKEYIVHTTAGKEIPVKPSDKQEWDKEEQGTLTFYNDGAIVERFNIDYVVSYHEVEKGEGGINTP